MKRLCLILLFAAGLAGCAYAQVTPVMVRTNGTLVGRFTNVFEANLDLLRKVVVEKSNPVVSGLVATNGVTITGNSTVDGELAAKVLRIWGATTNRIVYVGTNGVLVSLAGVDPQLLLYLVGLQEPLLDSLNRLTTNSGGVGVASTNGTATGLSLLGTTTVGGPLTTGTNLASLGSGLITTTNLGNYPGAIATLTDVAITAPTIASNLAALKDAIVGPAPRLGIVLADTGADGAAGDWYWDPVSTAPESAVVTRPTGYSALTPGRWRKR